MSQGPIVKSSRVGSSGLQAAGFALLAQAGLRAFFLAGFLLTLSRTPRLSAVIFGNLYLLMTSVVVPAVFLAVGLVTGFMLIARLRGAAGVAGAFCILGLVFQAFAAFGIVMAYAHTSHHPPMLTYVLMAMNAAIYLGTLIVVSRSA